MQVIPFRAKAPVLDCPTLADVPMDILAASLTEVFDAEEEVRRRRDLYVQAPTKENFRTWRLASEHLLFKMASYRQQERLSEVVPVTTRGN